MQKIFLILPFILLFSLTSCERNEEVIKSTKQSVVGIETTTGGISKAEVMKSEAIIGTGVISEYGNINQPINQST